LARRLEATATFTTPIDSTKIYYSWEVVALSGDENQSAKEI